MIAWAPYPRSGACGPRSGTALARPSRCSAAGSRRLGVNKLSHSFTHPTAGAGWGPEPAEGGPVLGGTPEAATDAARAATRDPKRRSPSARRMPTSGFRSESASEKGPTRRRRRGARAASHMVPRSARGRPRSAVLRRSVSQELPRRRAGALALLERDLAVHQRPVIARGPLDPAPLAARDVVHDLGVPPIRQALQTRQVVDDHVRGPADRERAAVAEAGGSRGQIRELVVRLLERESLLVAHQPR